MTSQDYTLAELADRTGSRLEGAGDRHVCGVAPLESAGPDDISFLANPRYRAHLAETRAGAVILPDTESADAYDFAVLRTDNPYLVFARIARMLNPTPHWTPGVHGSASVAGDARIAGSARVDAQAVIGEGAMVGARCRIGPGAVIGANVVMGDDCRIDANAAVLDGVRLGTRVHVLPGAVIGGEGFGFAHAGDHWEPVPQLGSVVIGDDVSIGANTTVDRGSQGDTVVGSGCKIDNLVQVAHNVHIGEHTIIASGTGISGSTRIGRYCTIGGSVGFAGHLEIADGVTFTGMAMVIGHVPEAGVYSSGIPAMPTRDWRRSAVRFRQLDDMARRLEKLEKAMENTKERDEQ